jgi:hypothetical protein
MSALMHSVAMMPLCCAACWPVSWNADYIKLLCDCVLPAVPDFSWGHASNGEVDRDGYCIVTVQVMMFSTAS